MRIKDLIFLLAQLRLDNSVQIQKHMDSLQHLLAQADGLGHTYTSYLSMLFTFYMRGLIERDNRSGCAILYWSSFTGQVEYLLKQSLLLTLFTGSAEITIFIITFMIK